MMEDFDKNDERFGNDGKFRDEIYSKAVRAGKRTYFFDVKSTKRDEYYLSITESKKRFDQDGNYHYEKHKVFLYKEDFEKFMDGLDEVMTFIQQNQQVEYDKGDDYEEYLRPAEAISDQIPEKSFTKIDFEAL